MTHVAIHVITTSHIDGGITLVTASTFTKHIQTPFVRSDIGLVKSEQFILQARGQRLLQPAPSLTQETVELECI